MQSPKHHIKGSGCPICNESIGEKKIYNYLNKNNIYCIKQKRFNDCKDIYTLPFDFYIPSYNLCIEFDGSQHYMPIDVWGGIAAFKQIQKRDLIKTNYCKTNKINLLRIKYSDNIIKSISEYFKL